DGRSAGVHADALAVERMEIFDLPGKSVIEAQWHRDAESRMSSRARYEPFILGARKKRGQMGIRGSTPRQNIRPHPCPLGGAVVRPAAISSSTSPRRSCNGS